MDLRKIKTLIDLVSDSGVAELEITEGDDHVRIVNRNTTVAVAPAVAAPVVAAPVAPAPVAAPAPAPAPVAPVVVAAPTVNEDEELIAVLAAAIAMAESENLGAKFRVVSFRRK